ncbi:MAG: hypothetical protein ACJ8AK_03160 [Gemmatimonadaceae bacterium]
MRWIRPQLDAPTETLAEEQEEYCPLTAAFVKHPSYGIARGVDYNTVIVAVRPSDEERRRIAAGDDLYIGVLTYGSPLQPLLVLVGREEASFAYNVGIHL